MKAEPAPIYTQLRSRLLETPPPAGRSIFLMDWPLNGAVATVVAGSEGTVSLYFSTGAAFIGGGQGHTIIRDAGQAALDIATQLRSRMVPARNFPLPSPDEVVFYLVADGEVFSATTLEVDLKSGHSPFTRLGNAAQNIITQYRLKYPRPNSTVH